MRALVVRLIFTSWLQKQNWSSKSVKSWQKIADKNRDGWLVVQEYETDDLASDSEDEKKIRKAKAAAEKKRKEAKGNIGNTSKKFKSSSDFQLFRGKTTIYFYFVKFSVFLVGLPEHPTINLLYQVIYLWF